MHTIVMHGMGNVKILPYSCSPILSSVNIWLWVRVMKSLLQFLSSSVKMLGSRHFPKQLIPTSIRSLCDFWVLAQKPNPVIIANRVHSLIHLIRYSRLNHSISFHAAHTRISCKINGYSCTTSWQSQLA
jgi:hypothetical protein